ncbi:YheU family protein [Reinekea marina]|uniref:YheU family protein n=1 Tax=Reinekea marina TaxID=1310421 RepID=A0ABV7WT28_9GAMM|nr:YheU family protein [Reinekea marina]MDN3648909.1 YheU family protein [Reinekea marina]
MIIPPKKLNPETLNALIEDWLSRQEQSWAFDMENHEQLVERVIQKLNENELLITWDEEGQSLNILDKARYDLYFSEQQMNQGIYD